MIQSMTGFATKSLTLIKDKDHKATVTIHLKSLNSRYFELNAKLPPALSHLETDLIKLFKKTLHRGYVHFTIYVDNPSIFKGAIEPSLGMVQGYVNSITKIKKLYEIPGSLSMEVLVRLPGIFNTEEQSLDKKSTDAILQTTQELIQQVIKEREKEGKILQKDFEKRIASMSKEIHTIEKRSKELIEEQKKKISTVLQELHADENEMADARKSALFSVLDKMDIHEEIVRFKSHLDNLLDHLKSSDVEKGKRLDFTLQELAREINTVTAKCSDATISKNAINIKVEIEKAREQTQNIV